MSRIIALINGKVITPLREIPGGTVLIEDGVIADFGPSDKVMCPSDAEIIDVNGAYVSPGFIDLHLHGAWGGDVMNASLEDLEKISRGLARRGTTSFLPTTLSGPLESIARAVDVIEEARSRNLSGMSGLRRISAYRVSGVIESALLLDELSAEMIA